MDVLVWLDVLRCGRWIVVMRCVIRSRIVEGHKEGASDEHVSVRATMDMTATVAVGNAR